jgi:hypothetical protein
MSLGDAATAPENGDTTTVNLGLTNPQDDEMNAHVQEVLSSEVRARSRWSFCDDAHDSC